VVTDCLSVGVTHREIAVAVGWLGVDSDSWVRGTLEVDDVEFGFAGELVEKRKGFGVSRPGGAEGP